MTYSICLAIIFFMHHFVLIVLSWKIVVKYYCFLRRYKKQIVLKLRKNITLHIKTLFYQVVIIFTGLIKTIIWNLEKKIKKKQKSARRSKENVPPARSLIPELTIEPSHLQSLPTELSPILQPTLIFQSKAVLVLICIKLFIYSVKKSKQFTHKCFHSWSGQSSI